MADKSKKRRTTDVERREAENTIAAKKDSADIKQGQIHKDNLVNAEQLYERVKSLYQNTNPLDQDNAKLIVELAEDAIKEFAHTNQDKKVELRNWKEQAELVLPPQTVEELRKRAEGHALQNFYPKNPRLRIALLGIIIFVVLLVLCIPIIRFFLPNRGSEELKATVVDSMLKEGNITIKIAVINNGTKQALVSNLYPIIYKDPKHAYKELPDGSIRIVPSEASLGNVSQLPEGLPATIKPGDILYVTISSPFDSTKYYWWGDPIQNDLPGYEDRRRIQIGLHFSTMDSNGAIFETAFPFFELDIEKNGRFSTGYTPNKVNLFEDQWPWR